MLHNRLPTQKAKHHILCVLFSLTQATCAGRSVVTKYDPEKISLQTPQEYQDPQQAIREVLNILPKAKRTDTRMYALNIFKTLIDNQDTVTRELKHTKKLKLEPGKSYSFQLESFCLDAKLERPKAGDEHLVSAMASTSQAWFSLISAKYKDGGVSQKDAQILIWSLLTGAKFDELSSKNQKNLLKIYPDAYVRFGNSVVESKIKDIISDALPAKISEAVLSVSELKSLLQENVPFERIEKILAPVSNRSDIFKPGWTKMNEGYLIKVETNGYQGVGIKIFAPKTLPQNVTFDPTKLVTAPKEGQRLGLSPNVIVNKYDKYPPLGNISLKEATLVVRYPLDAASVLSTAIEAENASNAYFKGEDQHNTKVDAFRHFIWAGLAANDIGTESAREFLTAHEDIPKNPTHEKEMDLKNNDEGFGFFQNYQGSNFKSDFLEEGLQKVKKGELTWL